MKTNDAYAVWSEQRGAWWGPGSRGYRRKFSESGRFSREQALDICRNALFDCLREKKLTELPVRVSRMIAALETGASLDAPIPVDPVDVREFIETSPIAKAVVEALDL